jgi:hypothetical protein
MPGSFELVFKDNTDAVIANLEKNAAVMLEELGMRVERYMKENTPVGTTESTGVQHYIGGTLRQSMTHMVIGYELYVGSDLSYAPYVEYGTGIYASDGTGRKSPWVWRDKNGEYHWTRGIHPQHMILKAVTNHDAEYKFVMQEYLKK